MEIRAWNHHAEELWGLRADEIIGSHFLSLDIGFPVEKLRLQIRSCLSGRTDRVQVVQPAVNRPGRQIECTADISGLNRENMTKGVILLMDASGHAPVRPAGASETTRAASRASADGARVPDQPADESSASGG
jgi:two-component system, chemotaxis family, CheB/CheR fusion protein